MGEPTRHDPMLTSAQGRVRADCSCGWRSRVYTTVSGAHLAFGEHLTDGQGGDVEYGVEVAGRVIVGPGWTCVADVVAGARGQGSVRALGVLVRREGSGQAWVPVEGPVPPWP